MNVKNQESLFHNSEQTGEEQPLSVSFVSEQTKIPTEKDVIELAYQVIQRRIEERLCEEYPEARWVWESHQTKKRIQEGADVFILLNQAGGYRRAKVLIKNLQMMTLLFETHEEKKPLDEESDEDEDEAEVTEESTEVNYELLAFEWTDSHIQDLNERCNEVIAGGIQELIISSQELPVEESWNAICQELKRAGVSKVSCIPEGIKISIGQE